MSMSVTSDRRHHRRVYVSSRARLWTIAAIALAALPAHAQTPPAPTPPLPGFVNCAATGLPLQRIPEIVSQKGVLRGTILLSVENNRMKEKPGAGTSDCVLQFNRTYRAINGTLPGYPGTVPPGFPGYVPPPALSYATYSDPVPGPTLRARVGDVIELTFLNQIDPNKFGKSIDRGETTVPADGCDVNTNGPYPYSDSFPDCFHGSSTGNIHFHGTHTNPSTTGDNVFIEVRPSLRVNDKATISEAIVRPVFDKFFDQCEKALKVDQRAQWPYSWDDMPKAFVKSQEKWLKEYDAKNSASYKNFKKLWPVDEAQIKAGGWPQYYIGAYPYCFHLPVYTASTFPPPATAPSMPGMTMEMDAPLQMGQAPGTHWYHSHKHGSTTINVTNGMTGAFIIEGKYDDDLNAFYGTNWTRTQPVMEIQELGGTPILFSGGNGTGANATPLSVNGLILPTVAMKPGEVQLWRIVNSAARSGVEFVTPSNGIEWKMTARDGVQLADSQYQKSLDKAFLMAAGNRVDILVKAPSAAGTYPINVGKAVKGSQVLAAETKNAPLLNIVVSGTPAGGPTSQFIAQAPPQPAFLQDIKASEVTGTKRLVFNSGPAPVDAAHPPLANGPPFHLHTIDGKTFDGEVGEVVLLNKVEEWTIVNTTATDIVNKGNTPGPIDHPFHIHINPFQIVELFDPNDVLRDASDKIVSDAGKPLPKYIISTTSPATAENPAEPDNPRQLKNGQCWVDPSKQETWKPCANAESTGRIWWDVFGIPSGLQVNLDPTKPPTTATVVTIPGYFKMRSRFVDFKGLYVLHCHILAHEDRGMMTIVEVVPYKTIYAHH